MVVREGVLCYTSREWNQLHLFIHRERGRERERDKSFTPYVHLHTGSVKSFTLCSFTWRARKWNQLHIMFIYIATRKSEIIYTVCSFIQTARESEIIYTLYSFTQPARGRERQWNHLHLMFIYTAKKSEISYTVCSFTQPARESKIIYTLCSSTPRARESVKSVTSCVHSHMQTSRKRTNHALFVCYIKNFFFF